ncbi:cytochrome-c peroxidase [Vacuolonema iberomarrocanum]|uniref:cytochrome-c peroxidase n=1 Tax=Vacuolonema iberomarrocanum TaxID=3454632 RepID=UPI0019DEBF9F|nr:cytochrome B6 [filamentous cyanobacterium LEGE 07170]
MRRFLNDRQTFRQFYLVGLVLFAILVALVWQQVQSPNTLPLRTAETPAFDAVNEPIQPLPEAIAVADDKFALGETLFNDVRLSKSRQVSCASCHNLQMGGVDRQPHSPGVDGAMTAVNTPTVFNVAYNFRFNWNGKFSSLVEHTDALMQNPRVMGSEWPDVLSTLDTVSDYHQAFTAVYEDGITRTNVIDAIVAYETALITPNSRFDRYLQGDQTALSPTEQEGYGLFKAYGCVSCHQGVNVGGNMFQKFGVVGDYFADRGNVTEADFGRFNVTQDEADRYVFRVPSLRNVAVTPPYFHDGTADTLEQAIEIMVKYQLGRPIPSEHVQQIAQFLQTLTGEHQEETLTAMRR